MHDHDKHPLDAATAVLDDPALPAGDDERFVGFGVMGLPFGSGHYLALRQFPATSFSLGYRSVWHRDSDGVWTFYATTPGPQSCARYFGAATARDAVQCDIDVAWVTPWSLLVEIPGLLAWRIDLRATVATRLMSALGARLPQRAWTSRAVLGRAAGSGSAERCPTVSASCLRPRRCGRCTTPRRCWTARTWDRSGRCDARPGWPVSGPRSAGCSRSAAGISRTSTRAVITPRRAPSQSGDPAPIGWAQ